MNELTKEEIKIIIQVLSEIQVQVKEAQKILDIIDKLQKQS